MKSLTEYLGFDISQRRDYINITRKVEELVESLYRNIAPEEADESILGVERPRLLEGLHDRRSPGPGQCQTPLAPG